MRGDRKPGFKTGFYRLNIYSEPCEEIVDIVKFLNRYHPLLDGRLYGQVVELKGIPGLVVVELGLRDLDFQGVFIGVLEGEDPLLGSILLGFVDLVLEL